MSINSFGRLLRLTSWGESHGPAIGGVLDGCPPGIAVSEADIQPFLDARAPGGALTSQRREPDAVRLLSGLFEGRTTGTPIAFMIDNVDQRSRDYDELARAYRPNHADWTYQAKYGHRDWRGGGRASARETAVRVAGGAIARRIIPSVTIRAALVAMGGDEAQARDWARVSGSALNCPDPAAEARWTDRLKAERRAGGSLGGIIEAEALGVAPGWGAPLYGRLDADLAAAMLSIPASKGMGIGDGFAAAAATGAQHADPMRAGADGRPQFLANHDGGIAGGIATGQPIRLAVAFKPTSSRLQPVDGVDAQGRNVEIVTRGRHDPCVAIRAVPVVEAMIALVLADHFLLHRGQNG